MEITLPTKAQIALYRSLFRVREDVFALRWEKSRKSGYFPAYSYDPYLFKLHKIKGGTLNNYQDKKRIPLTDEQLIKHFSGRQFVGGYPLLEENTSWFIAADFDKSNWIEDSRKFMRACAEKNISAYLERSRSGNGAHVWVFFDQDYSALKSRKVIKSILEEVGIFSVFDKASSFDRLFPNQDSLSGKGFGNLIALPLQGTSLQNNNSCFLDENSLDPYLSQWQFLKNVKRTSTQTFDQLYESFSQEITPSAFTSRLDKLEISLDNELHIKRAGLTPSIINFIREELNFANSEYFVKNKSGKSTWDTQRYFKFIEDREFEVITPRGFAGRLMRFFKDQQIDFRFHDLRKKKAPVLYTSGIDLLEHQQPVLTVVEKKEFGVIVAPPGSGKTIVGLQIIAEKRQPALVIVHRKQIAEQWIERIQAFLGIPKREIGLIGQGKGKVGEKVTVAMIQSLAKKVVENPPEIINAFGTIIIDECHHIPAETYAKTISKLFPYFQYGLTATPFRKYSDGKAIFIHLGEVIAEIKQNEIESFRRARIVVRNTDFNFPFDSKTDQFETLSKVLIHDTGRNRLILKDVVQELKNGHKAIIITERKEHIDTLYQFLKQSYETITLSGEDSQKARDTKWRMLKSGNYQVLITTGQFFGEGSDLQNASRLFLAYPFSFKGKLIQYIGRVQRSEITPVIYDYHDHNIGYLHRLFLKRNTHYRNMDKQASLFDDPEENIPLSEKGFKVDKQIKVPVDNLDFRFGSIAFTYQVQETNDALEFEIENDNVRPEFDVLKPYFVKVLNTKSVVVQILAEFQDHQLVSQDASSPDLEKIDREIIESVKVRFIERAIFRKTPLTEDEPDLMDLQQLQPGGKAHELYNSEEDLLRDILNSKKVKHYHQLRYLAARHEKNILKLRFVLAPFSFVFLLSGNEQFHLVLETLDTEEATYIWHFEKNIQKLKEKIKKVNQNLNLIRNEGRQVFLEQQPESFSRVLHDYSDERRGFIVWKDQLEERLI